MFELLAPFHQQKENTAANWNILVTLGEILNGDTSVELDDEVMPSRWIKLFDCRMMRTAIAEQPFAYSARPVANSMEAIHMSASVFGKIAQK